MSEIQKVEISESVANVVLAGDLSKLDNSQKVDYYRRFCHSLGLNPVTQPFKILRLQGKEVLYATKDATEQLRKIHGVSFVDQKSEVNNELGFYKVIVKVQDKTGRYDFGTGVIATTGLKGDSLANGIMKAETKAKRRATLSICGLGMLDESEKDTIGRGQYKEVSLEEPLEEPLEVPKEVYDELLSVTSIKELTKFYNKNKQYKNNEKFITSLKEVKEILYNNQKIQNNE